MLSHSGQRARRRASCAVVAAASFRGDRHLAAGSAARRGRGDPSRRSASARSRAIFDLAGGERSLSEDELTRLAEACLRHPLSLRVAALFLKTHKGQSIARYVERIEEDRARLRLEGQPDHDVMAVLGLSVKQLAADDDALAARWRMLSVFPEDFDAAAAAAVWAIANADDATDALNTLEGRGLVEAIGEDRYRFHDLLRDLERRDVRKRRRRRLR